MNINQIKYFVSAFEQSSFSLAAKAENVTVQAVSKAINDLEREVDTKLFVRANRCISATPEGREFYKRARVALTAFRRVEAFPGDVDEETSKASFKVALCAPTFQGSDTLGAALSEFVRQQIGAEVDFTVVNPLTVEEDLKTGVIDALLTIGKFDKEGIKCVPVGKLPTGIMVSKDHPLAQKQVVALADIAPYPAAMSPWYDTFNTSILVMYRDAGLISNIRPVESLAASEKLLQAEEGYFFSAMYPVTTTQDDATRLLPIDPSEGLPVPICIATAEGAKSSQFNIILQYLEKMPALMTGAKQGM